MSVVTRQAVLAEPGRFEYISTELTAEPGQLLVEMIAVGLCPFELKHWKGLRGTYPQTVGHEPVGRVLESGAGVLGFEPGDVVTGYAHGLTAFADHLVMPAAGAFHVAPGIDPTRALGEPAKCVLTVVEAAEPRAGHVGVIVGSGPMGLLATQILSHTMLRALVVVDTVPERLALAREFGATHTIDASVGGVLEQILAITDGQGADFVIEGTGVPELLQDCCTYARARGRVVLMSSYTRPAREFDFQPAISRGLTIIAAHPPYAADGFDMMRRAVGLINDGTVRFDPVVTHSFPLDDVQGAFETLDSKSSNYLKGIVVGSAA